jgi:hypothetical protein
MGAFFFLSALLDPIHLYEKKMNETQTNFFGLYYACFGHAVDIKRRNMPPSVHYTTQSVYNKTQNYASGQHQTLLGRTIGQSGEKRSRVIN